MDIEFQGLLSWAESNHKKLVQAEKVLKRQKKPDELMRDLHEKVFEEVDCLRCANCCRTTGPLLTSQDVARISKHLKMSEGSFVSTYLRTDEDGDMVFRSMPCPFLGSDNYCVIYENRPRACREFPHTDQKGQLNILHLTRKNARICPAVARMLQQLIR